MANGFVNDISIRFLLLQVAIIDVGKYIGQVFLEAKFIIASLLGHASGRKKEINPPPPLSLSSVVVVHGIFIAKFSFFLSSVGSTTWKPERREPKKQPSRVLLTLPSFPSLKGKVARRTLSPMQLYLKFTLTKKQTIR